MKTEALFSGLFEEGGSDAVAEDVSTGPGTKWGDWIVLLENCRCSTQMRQSFGLECDGTCEKVTAPSEERTVRLAGDPGLSFPSSWLWTTPRVAEWTMPISKKHASHRIRCEELDRDLALVLILKVVLNATENYKGAREGMSKLFKP